MIGAAEVAQVNLPVAVLVWLMVIPMLLKIDLAALGQVGAHWKGIAATVGVNWLVKPFSMALLAWVFIAHVFRPYLPADQIDSYTAGLILLAAAPCTAMVFVWSNLVEGEPHFTLGQVALNDAIMVVAFAPIVGLLLGLSSITVPWGTLLLSVVLYIIVPVIVAQLWRRMLLARGGQAALDRTLQGPVAAVARGAAADARAAVRPAGRADHAPAGRHRHAGGADPDPGLFQCGAGLLVNRRLGVEWCVAGPSALIGASNFFELAVATAIALFGFQSGAALATVVGVLVEVPVMLSVVQIVKASRGWYERGAGHEAARPAGPGSSARARSALCDRAPGARSRAARSSAPYPAALWLAAGASFSRLATEEAARLLRFFGAEPRIFDPSDLPHIDQLTDRYSERKEEAAKVEARLSLGKIR